MADLGELAIRLGAISSVDRKGSAIALDDFESPLLKWVTAATSGGSVTLGTTSVRSGSQAIKLFATNSVGAHATIRKYLFPVGIKPQGIEIHFATQSTASLLYIEVTYYDGTNKHEALLYLDFKDRLAGIQQVVGIGTVFATGLVFSSSNHQYEPLKLVMDFDNDEYVRVIIGGTEYDLSAYTIPKTADVSSPFIYLQTYIKNKDGVGTVSLWLDDFIYTTNELA